MDQPTIQKEAMNMISFRTDYTSGDVEYDEKRLVKLKIFLVLKWMIFGVVINFDWLTQNDPK